MKKLPENYYSCLTKIGKYKTVKEIEELSERERQLYDIAGLNIFSIMASFKLYEMYKLNCEADQLIEDVNKLLLILSDYEMELAHYLTCLNETTEACSGILIGKKCIRLESFYDKIKNDAEFVELCEAIYKLKNSDKTEERMNLF